MSRFRARCYRLLPFARPLSRRKLPIRPRYWAPAWFEIDGANSVDMWGRQTIFANIPLMAVDEMSVPTNAFTPEYGGGTGSVVNLVTRSGGSNYHGQLLELWRPAATEASLSGFTTTNAASGNDITSDTRDQTALAVSGRLLSQKSTSSSPANGTARP